MKDKLLRKIGYREDEQPEPVFQLDDQTAFVGILLGIIGGIIFAVPRLAQNGPEMRHRIKQWLLAQKDRVFRQNRADDSLDEGKRVARQRMRQRG